MFKMANMLRSLFLISSTLGAALASPQLERRAACNHDNCLRIMIRSSAAVASFCSTYTTATTSATLPVWAAECSGLPSRISSGCSCINTATVTSVPVSTTTASTVVTTSSSTPGSTTSSTSSTDITSSTTSTTSSSFSSSTTSSLPTTSSSTSDTTSSTSSSTASSTSSTSSSESSSTSSSTSSSEPSTTTSSTSSSDSSTTSSSTSSSDSSSTSSSTTSSESSSTSLSTSSSAPSSTSTSTSSSTSATGTPCPQTSAPPGAIAVDNSANPAPGSYPTMQKGVNALSLTSTTPQSLFIYPGSYYEQVYIPPLLSNLTVQGYTADCSSYEGNQATITYNLALLNTTSDDLTATIRSWNPNTKFYNLNIANTFGHVSHNGQNLAVSAHTGNQGYYGVQLLSYQDTLLANTGNQLYAKCLIVGAVDFIFGQQATAWFENVDIRTIAAGSITASGRASATNPSWYVINNSNIDGINGSIPAGTNYLGRPWYPFARVVFQNSYLSDVIKPAGWSVWSTAVNGSTNIQNVTLAEYGNYGPGSVLEEGPRANFSVQFTAPVTIESILGASYQNEWWIDMNYM